MQELKETEKILTKEDYNDEPVIYCTHCLSLAIRVSENTDYCDDCGSTDLDTININDWNELFEKRYNKRYIN